MFVDKHIKETIRIPQPEGRADYLRLDQNENPDGIPQWLFNSVISRITPEFLSIYPEETRLTDKYAKKIGVDLENVTLTDGSVVGMGYVIKTFGEPSKELLCVTPTFGMYKVYAEMNGMTVTQVPYDDNYHIDINSIISRITSNTGIVVLVNPNMPIGNTYSLSEIESVVMKALKVEAYVLIDEAYYYFFNESSIELIKKYPNVIVLRTFSKMLSIPALRIGAIISTPEIIKYINNYKPHYTVNSVALLFGEAIVDNHDRLIDELYHNYKIGKEYLIKALKQNNYETIEGDGCFICIKPKNTSSEVITQRLKSNGILILCGSGALQGYLRVSICNEKYMKMFMKALLKVDVVL